MIFSRPLLGTDTKKVALSWIEYYWNSCIIQGWVNCWYAFQNWADLMGNNYQNYALLASDDPLEQCILYFWDSLEDDIYPKYFLDNLLQMVDDIESGKEKLIPMDEVFMKRLQDITEGIELDQDLEAFRLWENSDGNV